MFVYPVNIHISILGYLYLNLSSKLLHLPLKKNGRMAVLHGKMEVFVVVHSTL